MPGPSQKTTVYLDQVEYRRLKQLARARGCAPALLLREAVAEYTMRYAPAKLPRGLGAFRSGKRNLGSRADALLKGMGRA
jgi:predicted transcriptional regulator